MIRAMSGTMTRPACIQNNFKQNENQENWKKKQCSSESYLLSTSSYTRLVYLIFTRTRESFNKRPQGRSIASSWCRCESLRWRTCTRYKCINSSEEPPQLHHEFIQTRVVKSLAYSWLGLRQSSRPVIGRRKGWGRARWLPREQRECRSVGRKNDEDGRP